MPVIIFGSLTADLGHLLVAATGHVVAVADNLGFLVAIDTVRSVI
jgi:hypothetical protein